MKYYGIDLSGNTRFFSNKTEAKLAYCNKHVKAVYNKRGACIYPEPVCNWVRLYGDFGFSTDCGRFQGENIRPKQVKCFCGKRIKRHIQFIDGTTKEVTGVRVRNSMAFYTFSD